MLITEYTDGVTNNRHRIVTKEISRHSFCFKTLHASHGTIFRKSVNARYRCYNIHVSRRTYDWHGRVHVVTYYLHMVYTYNSLYHANNCFDNFDKWINLKTFKNYRLHSDIGGVLLLMYFLYVIITSMFTIILKGTKIIQFGNMFSIHIKHQQNLACGPDMVRKH